MPMRTTTRRVT